MLTSFVTTTTVKVSFKISSAAQHLLEGLLGVFFVFFIVHGSSGGLYFRYHRYGGAEGSALETWPLWRTKIHGLLFLSLHGWLG